MKARTTKTLPREYREAEQIDLQKNKKTLILVIIKNNYTIPH